MEFLRSILFNCVWKAKNILNKEWEMFQYYLYCVKVFFHQTTFGSPRFIDVWRFNTASDNIGINKIKATTNLLKHSDNFYLRIFSIIFQAYLWKESLFYFFFLLSTDRVLLSGHTGFFFCTSPNWKKRLLKQRMKCKKLAISITIFALSYSIWMRWAKYKPYYVKQHHCVYKGRERWYFPTENKAT